MGGDGGCHPNGRKFMRGTMEKSREEKERAAAPDRRELNLIRTRTCALTNEALLLDQPVVADELGNLFNKEALITALVDKSLPVEFSHVRGLKDVVTCEFHANPSWLEATANGTKGEAAGGAYWSTDVVSPYACPITQLEMNGRNGFVLVRPTGKVVSERALREMGEAALQQEYGPFTADDVTKLAPSDGERAALVQRLQARRAVEAHRKAEKAARKDKKRKRKEAAAAPDGAADGVAEVTNATDARAAAADDSAAAAASSRASQAAKKAKTGGTQMSGAHASRAAAIMGEVQRTSGKASEASSVYKGLFKGKGAKHTDATTQFIVQGGVHPSLA